MPVIPLRGGNGDVEFEAGLDHLTRSCLKNKQKLVSLGQLVCYLVLGSSGA